MELKRENFDFIIIDYMEISFRITNDYLEYLIEVATYLPEEQIKQIMESAVELEIPNKVDYESGKNWGDIK